MGIYLLYGRGVDQNKIHGISLITEAASMGLAEAAALLGDFCTLTVFQKIYCVQDFGTSLLLE